jgi:hypothetical protein
LSRVIALRTNAPRESFCQLRSRRGRVHVRAETRRRGKRDDRLRLEILHDPESRRCFPCRRLPVSGERRFLRAFISSARCGATRGRKFGEAFTAAENFFPLFLEGGSRRSRACDANQILESRSGRIGVSMKKSSLPSFSTKPRNPHAIFFCRELDVRTVFFRFSRRIRVRQPVSSVYPCIPPVTYSAYFPIASNVCRSRSRPREPTSSGFRSVALLRVCGLSGHRRSANSRL